MILFYFTLEIKLQHILLFIVEYFPIDKYYIHLQLKAISST